MERTANRKYVMEVCATHNAKEADVQASTGGEDNQKTNEEGPSMVAQRITKKTPPYARLLGGKSPKAARVKGKEEE